MSYATQQDLVDRYGAQELQDLTDRTDPPAGAINADIVQSALDDADGMLNGFIAVRVPTPVDPVTRTLKQMACQIARYILWSDRASDRVAQDYQDAIAWAKGVGAGTVALGDNTAPTAAPSAGSPQFESGPRIFTRESLRHY